MGSLKWKAAMMWAPRQVFLAVVVSMYVVIAGGQDEGAFQELPNEGCKDGTCPTPSSILDPSSGNDKPRTLWMDPSPIKHAEEHGFGLGIFTGKPIPAGTTIEDTFYGHGEIMLPLYGSSTIFEARTHGFGTLYVPKLQFAMDGTGDGRESSSRFRSECKC